MIAILSDLHCGNFARGARRVEGWAGLNSRAKLTVETLRAACAQALNHGATSMIWNGDVTHTKRPEPQLLAMIADTARMVAGKIPLFVNRGNHDLIGDADGADTLGVLRQIPGVRVVTEPAMIWLPSAGDAEAIPVLFVPYRALTGEMTALAEIAAAIDAKKHTWDGGHPDPIVVAHYGLTEDTTGVTARLPDFCNAALMAELAWTGGVRAVFHGHGHIPIDAATDHPVYVGQVGTLCPWSHSEDGIRARFMLVNLMGGLNGIRSIPVAAPYFATVRTAAELGALPVECPCFVRCAPELLDAVRALPNVEHATALPDAGEVLPVGMSAQLGPTAMDVPAMLAAYVDGCTFPAGVVGDAVLVRVRRRLEVTT